MATARVGSVLVNVNPALRLEELRHALARAEVEVLFLIPAFRSSRYVEMLCELVPEIRSPAPGRFASPTLPDLRAAVVWDPNDLERTDRWAPGLETWAAFLQAGADVAPETVAAQDYRRHYFDDAEFPIRHPGPDGRYVVPRSPDPLG